MMEWLHRLFGPLFQFSLFFIKYKEVAGLPYKPNPLPGIMLKASWQGGPHLFWPSCQIPPKVIKSNNLRTADSASWQCPYENIASFNPSNPINEGASSWKYANTEFQWRYFRSFY